MKGGKVGYLKQLDRRDGVKEPTRRRDRLGTRCLSRY